MPQSGVSMRIVAHPGTPLLDRARSVAVTTASTERLTVAPGDDLFETIHDRLVEPGISGGSFVLMGGSIARLTLMTGGPGNDDLPMGFHGPHVLAAPLTVVAGAGASGLDEDGFRFSHCHAVFRDAAGRLVGGHLLSGETIAGDGGIAIDIVPLSHGRFARRLDPETRFTIFHPEAI